MLPSKRLLSLDAFRGLTLAAMILVNNPGSWAYVYAPLEHAEWEGWTPTDLIFPFFLFIVGVAIKLSLDKYFRSEHALAPLLWRIGRRTVILFALGLFLYGFPQFDLSTWRIPGVLQRIAVCYFMASLIYIALARKTDGKVSVSYKPLLGIALFLLLLYYVLMKFVPVPGYGAGLWHSPETNLAAYIDRQVFGAHVWVYAKTWDPEGLLSTVPAVATTLSGVLTAIWLTSARSKIQKFRGMLLVGIGSAVLGQVLHFVLMPISKKIWTSSFVLLTTGLALILLSLIYWYADVKEHRRGLKPFLIFGSNAITVYFLSSFVATLMEMISFSFHGETVTLKGFIYSSLLQPVFGNYIGSLAFALLYVLFWLWIMSGFYKKRIFIKV